MKGEGGGSFMALSSTAIVLLVVGLIVGGAVGYTASILAAPATTSSAKTYTIGVVQPLSGEYAEYGKSFLNAAQLAVNQMNANLSAEGNNIQFKIVSADDAGTSSGANTALQTMYSTYGIHVLVGPLTSGEVTGVLQTADTDHIVVLPPAATATSLEFPRSSTNYLMRPGQPGDQFEGSALAHTIIQLGAKNVVYIYRDDTSEYGTFNISSAIMNSAGLKVDGIAYQPNQNDYSAQVQAAETDVQQFFSSGGTANNTVVALGGGGTEAANIFTHASSDPGLSSVRWFGIESLDDPTLLTGPVGPFMAKVDLTITSPASFNSPQGTYFNSTFTAAYGSPPLPYSNYAYDNTWIAMLAILVAGSNNGPSILSAVPIAADHYFGATGTGVWLDQFNDQTFAYYYILKVVPVSSTTSTTIQIGEYNGATNQVSLTST
jgi:branched-chain amino acid transport system substrate-binding protein